MASSHYIPHQDPFSQKHNQSQPSTALDFFSFTSPSDILAPHPDLFESELDLSLAGFDQLQLQLLAVDQPDPVYYRGDNPACGPPSTITVSSESASAYESLSSRSELYNSYSTPTNYSYPLDIDMDFSRVRLSAASDYVSVAAAQHTASGISALDAVSDRSYGSSEHSPTGSGTLGMDERDINSFGSLPSSPHVNNHGGSVYSDFSSDYYHPPISSHHPSLVYSGGNTVSPQTISQPNGVHAQARGTSPSAANIALPYLSRIARGAEGRHSISSQGTLPSPSPMNHSSESDDPRKKYACNQCSTLR